MTTENKGTDFAQLLVTLNAAADESNVLAKAMPMAASSGAADDKGVAAAAKAGGADGEDENEDDVENDGEDMGKSFAAVGADGKPVQLVDASDLLKSLTSRLDGTDEILAKALTGISATLTSQNAIIKSLQETVQAQSLQGRGRKTLLAVLDKPEVGGLMAKSMQDEGSAGQITAADLLAKSHAAFDAKAITGIELTTIDVCLRTQQPIDAGVLNKVAAHANANATR